MFPVRLKSVPEEGLAKLEPQDDLTVSSPQKLIFLTV